MDIIYDKNNIGGIDMVEADIMQCILKYIEEEERDDIKDAFFAHTTRSVKRGKNGYGVTRLSDIYIEMQERLRQKLVKANGQVSQDRIIKNLFKKMEKSERLEAIKNKAMPVYDKYCFLDRCRAFFLNDTLGYEIYDYQDGAIRLENMQTFLNQQSDGIRLDVDIVDLKAFVETCNAEKKNNKRATTKYYVIEKDGKKYGYNPNYLLDLVSMFNVNYIMARGIHDFAYVIGDLGSGILLPVRL